MSTEEPNSQPGKTTLSLFSGILGGVLITLTLVGIAVWFTTGIGLLRLMGVVQDGRVLINVDQPTVVRQIQSQFISRFNPTSCHLRTLCPDFVDCFRVPQLRHEPHLKLCTYLAETRNRHKIAH